MATDRKEYMREWRKRNRKRLADNQAKWRESHPERSKEINRKSRNKRVARDPTAETARIREWKRANPANVRKHVARHRAAHPEKRRARELVQTAVRSGFLVKPDKCEECGKETPSRGLHGHHEDYTKPLEVHWLCRKCHHTTHYAG